MLEHGQFVPSGKGYATRLHANQSIEAPAGTSDASCWSWPAGVHPEFFACQTSWFSAASPATRTSARTSRAAATRCRRGYVTSAGGPPSFGGSETRRLRWRKVGGNGPARTEHCRSERASEGFLWC